MTFHLPSYRVRCTRPYTRYCIIFPGHHSIMFRVRIKKNHVFLNSQFERATFRSKLFAAMDFPRDEFNEKIVRHCSVGRKIFTRTRTYLRRREGEIVVKEREEKKEVDVGYKHVTNFPPETFFYSCTSVSVCGTRITDSTRISPVRHCVFKKVQYVEKI